jgi:hypothetical protein
MVELITIIPGLSLVTNSVYKKNSKEFRQSLKIAILLSPPIFLSSIFYPNPVNSIFIGFMLLSIALFQRGYLEFAVASYTIAYNTNTIGLWVLPLVMFQVILT